MLAVNVSDVMPGDIVQTDRWGRWTFGVHGSVGIVIAVRQSNAPVHRISYPWVYWAFFPDRGVVGPLFRSEIRSL